MYEAPSVCVGRERGLEPRGLKCATKIVRVQCNKKTCHGSFILATRRHKYGMIEDVGEGALVTLTLTIYGL